MVIPARQRRFALQAVKAAGQRVAQLETANAELRASNRQLVQQVHIPRDPPWNQNIVSFKRLLAWVTLY